MENDNMITKKQSATLIFQELLWLRYTAIGSIIAMFVVFSLPPFIKYIAVGFSCTVYAYLIYRSTQQLTYLSTKYDIPFKGGNNGTQ